MFNLFDNPLLFNYKKCYACYCLFCYNCVKVEVAKYKFREREREGGEEREKGHSISICIMESDLNVVFIIIDLWEAVKESPRQDQAAGEWQGTNPTRCRFQVRPLYFIVFIVFHYFICCKQGNVHPFYFRSLCYCFSWQV